MSEESAAGPTIHLEQFLKTRNLVGSGGEAKLLIQGGEVHVNGKVETRRKRQLQEGDTVRVHQKSHKVADLRED